MIKWRQFMNWVKFALKHCWITIFIFINQILTSVLLMLYIVQWSIIDMNLTKYDEKLHTGQNYHGNWWLHLSSKLSIWVTSTLISSRLAGRLPWFTLTGFQTIPLKEVGVGGRPKSLLDLLTSNYPPNKWFAINRSSCKRNL